MGPRLSIIAGLLVGVLVAALLLAAVVAFAPEPQVPTPAPAVLQPLAAVLLGLDVTT